MEGISPNALVHLKGRIFRKTNHLSITDKGKGDNISKTDPVRYNWYQTVTDRNQLSEIDTTIYYCTPLIAPKRRSSGMHRPQNYPRSQSHLTNGTAL